MCKGVEQYRILKCSSLLPWRCLVRYAGQLPPHCGTLPSGSYWQASPRGPDRQLHSWRQTRRYSSPQLSQVREVTYISLPGWSPSTKVESWYGERGSGERLGT